MKKLMLSGVLLGVLFSTSVYAQSDSTATDDFFDMSLEDLLNVEVTVASTKALTSRESPGIVTIISEQEIQNSGARDLIDVLRLVPGLSFNTDVEGVVGLSVRGNWGHEGKVLLIIDGQEMNENLFSTTQFGNHYDVNQIKKIEIIRGPGSAIYGGYAEYGVIKITTKSAEDLNGIELNGTYGQLSDTYGRRNVSVGIGKTFGDFSYSIAGFLGQGQRSNGTFTDIYGDEGSMTGNSALDPSNINLGLKYKDLSARVIYDNYKTSSIAFYDAVLDTAAKIGYKSINTELKYDWKVKEGLTIIPKLNFITQSPWQTSDEENESFYRNNDLYYNLTTNKVVGNITANYDVNDKINVIAGTEYFVESAESFDSDYSDYFINGTNKINFNTISGFAQGLYKSDIANVTVGGRFINHSQFGAAFAPRIGITKVVNKFHAKLLYSQSFRAPGIENINLNETITPEQTSVAELELGYQIASNMFLTANVFDITTQNPIIYFYDEDTDEESYENFNQAGSRGFEIEYKVKDKWGYANINYSYYSTAGKNDVDYYVVAGNENVVVGIPQSKINLNSSIKVTDKLFVNPSFSYIGKRDAFTEVDGTETSVLTKIDPSMLLNLNIVYKDLLTDGLNVSLGVYDLLDQQYTFTQPYDGYHSPLPGTGREILLKLNYNFGFK